MPLWACPTHTWRCTRVPVAANICTCPVVNVTSTNFVFEFSTIILFKHHFLMLSSYKGATLTKSIYLSINFQMELAHARYNRFFTLSIKRHSKRWIFLQEAGHAFGKVFQLIFICNFHWHRNDWLRNVDWLLNNKVAVIRSTLVIISSYIDIKYKRMANEVNRKTHIFYSVLSIYYHRQWNTTTYHVDVLWALAGERVSTVTVNTKHGTDITSIHLTHILHTCTQTD